MTTQQSLRKIFSESAFDKKFTADMLKELVQAMTGHYPNRHEFQKSFLDFRNSTDLPVLKIYVLHEWRYLKSYNKYYLAKHNSHLNNEIRIKESRKK